MFCLCFCCRILNFYFVLIKKDFMYKVFVEKGGKMLCLVGVFQLVKLQFVWIIFVQKMFNDMFLFFNVVSVYKDLV